MSLVYFHFDIEMTRIIALCLHQNNDFIQTVCLTYTLQYIQYIPIPKASKEGTFSTPPGFPLQGTSLHKCTAVIANYFMQTACR